MRIVLVNHCHPDTPHVCATRLREFAGALAERGHRVALVTEPLRGGGVPPSARDITEMLKAGIEPSPMIVATPPKRRRVLKALRRGLWPWGIRQALIAYYYLLYGGLYADWRAGARPYVATLAADFKPDVVWASFGSVDCWQIARDIARAARCPWVGDLKDFWTGFIPGPLRNRLAARFRDAAAWTALSQTHAEASRPWFGPQIDVVYSGFEADAIRREKKDAPEDTLLMTLTGSVYGGKFLKPLFTGLANWANGKPEEFRKRLLFIYRGNAQFEVGAALARAKLPFQAKAGGFVPLDELQELHQIAFANLYVTNSRTFHHKAIELLAARRPILAFPPDHAEATDLAERTGGSFHQCRSAAHLAESLDEAFAEYEAPERPVDDELESLTWAAQAAELEKVFERVLAKRPKTN
jgi:glycosyltransferase involved in cell wall biosynthesis